MGLPLTSIVPWLALGTKAQTGGLACTHRGAWICRQGTQVLTAGKEQSDGPRGVAQTRVLATSWQSQGPEARMRDQKYQQVVSWARVDTVRVCTGCGHGPAAQGSGRHAEREFGGALPRLVLAHAAE